MCSLFSSINNVWEPLNDSNSDRGASKIIELKPGEIFTLDENNGYIEYKGSCVNRKKITLGVRESGPAAWGASIKIEKGSLYRWLPVKEGDHTWHFATEKKYLTVCNVGSKVDVIFIDENDSITWKRYIAVDIDAE